MFNRRVHGERQVRNGLLYARQQHKEARPTKSEQAPAGLFHLSLLAKAAANYGQAQRELGPLWSKVITYDITENPKLVG